MTIKIVQRIAERFIKDPSPGVLVIRGKWGVGKTYFWKSFIAARRADSSRRRYSYVSLFGLSSIRDLQLATYVNATDLSVTGGSTANPAKALAKKAATQAGEILPGWVGKSVSFAIDTLAPHLIRDTLVCLDDFERLSRTGIEFEEVLGFISSLKEEKNCKVVLIFNDEELQDRATVYRRYREKVIDIEVLFEPTTDEAADLALPADLVYLDIVREKLRILEVRNIRLIRKTVSNIQLVHPAVSDGKEWISKSLISMTVLLTFIEYGLPDGDRPTSDFLKNWNQLVYQYSRADKSKKKSEAQDEATMAQLERWSELLNKYNVMSFSTSDAALDRALKAGYVEESGLEQEITKLKDEADASEAEARFTRAWRLYHDSYEDNQAEIVTIIDQTFDAAAVKMSPGNVDATVRLLRSLGRDDIADDLIERYFRSLEGVDAQLFDTEQWGPGTVRDAEFTQRIAEHTAVFHPLPSLIDALKTIARRKGWSPEELKVVSDATADDLYEAFRSNPSDAIVKGCLQFATDSNLKHIAENATIAVKRIAGESLINRLRIESKFGISP
jgi:hypothetical protein